MPIPATSAAPVNEQITTTGLTVEGIDVSDMQRIIIRYRVNGSQRLRTAIANLSAPQITQLKTIAQNAISADLPGNPAITL